MIRIYFTGSLYVSGSWSIFYDFYPVPYYMLQYRRFLTQYIVADILKIWVFLKLPETHIELKHLW